MPHHHTSCISKHLYHHRHSRHWHMLLDGESSQPGKSVTLVGYGQRQVGHTHIGSSAHLITSATYPTAQLISSRRQHIRQLNSSHHVGNISDSSTHLISSATYPTAQLVSSRRQSARQLNSSRPEQHTSASSSHLGKWSLPRAHSFAFIQGLPSSSSSQSGGVLRHMNTSFVTSCMIAHSQTPIQRAQFPFPILYSYPASLSDPLSPNIQKPNTENRKPPILSDTPDFSASHLIVTSNHNTRSPR